MKQQIMTLEEMNNHRVGEAITVTAVMGNSRDFFALKKMNATLRCIHSSK